MTLTNVGSFIAATEKDADTLVNIVNTNLKSYMKCISLPDFIKTNNNTFECEINEVYGDLENPLKQIVKKCCQNHVHAEFSISYYGDYEGMYVFKNGVFEVKSADMITTQKTVFNH